jgi:hypothetical protein
MIRLVVSRSRSISSGPYSGRLVVGSRGASARGLSRPDAAHAHASRAMQMTGCLGASRMGLYRTYISAHGTLHEAS